MKRSPRDDESGTGVCVSPRWRLPPVRSNRATAASLVLGAILLLVVPYFLPVQSSFSDSYSFGFSNRGAVVLLGMFCLGFAFWRGPLAPADGRERFDSGTRRPLWAMLGLATVLHLAAWIVCLWYGPIQEARYMVDRIQHLSAGEKVFQDFEMAYGAGLLYLPLWISRALRVSLLSGYALSLFVEQAAGIVCLWYVVQRVGRKIARRNTIFTILCLTCLAWIPLIPAQYSTLRYWLAPAIGVLAYELAFESQQRTLSLLTLVGGFSLTLFVSQEQAIPLLAGVLLFGVLFGREHWRWLVPGLLGFAAVAGGLLWWAYRAKWLETLINIAGGAYAVPIGPAPILVPILALLLAAACYFVEAIRCRSAGTARTLLLCMSPFSLSAAFGRFDSVHLVANTFCATLVGWLVLSRNERHWRWITIVYCSIVFIVPTQLPLVYWHDLKLMARTPRRDPGNTVRKEGLRTFFSINGPLDPDRPGERLPFNYYTGRFYGGTDLVMPYQADELVAELRRKGDEPMLLSPMGCVLKSGRRAVILYTTGFFYPKSRHANTDLQPICEELEANYEDIPHPGLVLPQGVRLIRRRKSAP